MRPIRIAIGAATIDPALLTAAERLQYEGYLRREETNASILAMGSDGASIKDIRRKTGYSRKFIRAVLRGQRTDIFSTRQSLLEPWLPWLDTQWAAGRRNGSELWRELRQQGFRECLRIVGEWAGRRRRADKTETALGHAPAARTIARLLTTGRDHQTKAETITVAASALHNRLHRICVKAKIARRMTVLTFAPLETHTVASFREKEESRMSFERRFEAFSDRLWLRARPSQKSSFLKETRAKEAGHTFITRINITS